MAEMMMEPESVEAEANLPKYADEAPSREVQMKEKRKRKEKGKRR